MDKQKQENNLFDQMAKAHKQVDAMLEKMERDLETMRKDSFLGRYMK